MLGPIDQIDPDVDTHAFSDDHEVLILVIFKAGLVLVKDGLLQIKKFLRLINVDVEWVNF